MNTIARLAGALSALLLSAAASAAPGLEGRWITASGNLEVDIAPCGPAWCGTVSRVLGNRSMTPGGGAMKPVDTRPPLGMTVLHDLVPDEKAPDGTPTRWAGQLYNRENGKTYPCHVTTTGDSLQVRVSTDLPGFDGTQVWPRAAAR